MKIRANRKRLGLSQAELGERVGVSPATVSNWELDKAVPKRELAAALTNLFRAESRSPTNGLPKKHRMKIRANRKRLGLSQAELGERVGVSPATVSNWECDKAVPKRELAAALTNLFRAESRSPTNGLPKKHRSSSGPSRAKREAVVSQTPEAGFGDWVSEKRSALGLSRKELAAKVGISEISVYNIETGRTVNPREKTRVALEKVLGKAPEDVVEAVEEAAEIPGVGRLTDFDPHDEGEFPSEPGVYMFYDISERPVYVGESVNIRTRIRGQDGHVLAFWYKSPIVETAAYVKVGDPKLRKQLEETLIKFLKSNAVINKKGVERSRP